MFLCDFSNPDLPDPHGRVFTVVFNDPPVTIVCAYLAFHNPNTEDIETRCSGFRKYFNNYITDLVVEGKQRNRSVIVGGDLQVAPTVRDESITLRPPGPAALGGSRMSIRALPSILNAQRASLTQYMSCDSLLLCISHYIIINKCDF